MKTTANQSTKSKAPAKQEKKAKHTSPAPKKILEERLKLLRQVARETAQAYLTKVDLDLAALLKALHESAENAAKRRPLKDSAIKRTLKIAKKIDLKPDKGRRKDLRKIEKAVAAMSRLLLKK